MSGADRGLRGILAAACVSQSPVPFTCTPKIFENTDGSRTIYEIVDGKGKSRTIRQKEDKRSQRDERSSTAYSSIKAEEERSQSHEEHLQQDEIREEGISDSKTKSSHSEKDEEKKHDINQPINDSEEEEEEIEFDRKIKVKGTEVDGRADDPFADDIISITDHLQEQICSLYDGQIFDMEVEYGVIDDGHKIYLLGGSVTTTVDGLSKTLLKDIPNGEDEIAVEA